MTTNGRPSSRRGFRHEAAVYGSDAEMVRIVAAHLQGATVAGEPAIALLDEDQVALLRDVMDGAENVSFLPDIGLKGRPPAVIARFQSLVADLVERGAAQVRLVAAVPHPGLGAPWDGWMRYEAALNDVLRGVPAWCLCLYDARITPGAVLRDVTRTHPQVTSAGGQHRTNERYLDPTAFLAALPEPPLDPLERARPDIELDEPTPATGRWAVQTLAANTALDAEEANDLVTVTSEAVTNALAHGRPPVTLRAWAAADRIVIAISDGGPGPSNPHGGLVYPTHATQGDGGFGLWIMHNLCAAVFSTHDRDGFTIHLVGGRPLPLMHEDGGPPR